MGGCGVVLAPSSAIKPEENMSESVALPDFWVLLVVRIFLVTMAPSGSDTPGSAKFESEMPGHGGGVRP